MQPLVDDISTLTTIPTTVLQQLVNKAIFCICNDVEENKLKNENLTEIDIGLGTLVISVEDNSIQYKLIPCKKLEAAIKNTIINGKNPLVDTIEKTLTQKILNAYKQYL